MLVGGVLRRFIWSLLLHNLRAFIAFVDICACVGSDLRNGQVPFVVFAGRLVGAGVHVVVAVVFFFGLFLLNLALLQIKFNNFRIADNGSLHDALHVRLEILELA